MTVLQLFSANALDTFIQLLNKLGEKLLTPWRQNQPFSNSQCFALVSMATPLLELLDTMLVYLLNSGKICKDKRLLHGIFVLHTVLCSKLSAGPLYSVIQKVYILLICCPKQT